MNLFWELSGGPVPPAWSGACAVAAGLIFGSLGGMLAYRVPRGLALHQPRSFCPSCRALVAFKHNVPVLSFVFLRGKCARCGSRIHWRYPVSEALCGLLAVACWQAFGISIDAAAALFVCVVLVTLAVIDLEHGLLPDRLTLGLLWCGLAYSLVPKPELAGELLQASFPGPRQALAGAIAGYAMFWFINRAWRTLRKRDGLGEGDMKLVAALGAWTGLGGLPLIIGLSAIAGLAVGLALIVSGRARFSDAIPFGPFLAAGGLFALFLAPQAASWLLSGGFSRWAAA